MVRKGALPPVQISVEKRQGNKVLVTSLARRRSGCMF